MTGLALLFLLLSVADAYTTHLILKLGGIERHPVLRWLPG